MTHLVTTYRYIPVLMFILPSLETRHKSNSINKIGSRKFTSPGERYLAISTFSTIISNARRRSYDLNFKLKIVAEAVNNNREIASEYGISESMVRK